MGNSSLKVLGQRITVIDALRGFALLGVILIHMLQHFGYSSDSIQASSDFSKSDSIILWFSSRFIAGRFINIFSFLFGLSFFIQMDRASKKGVDFRGRFLWRMVLLFVIGLIGICFSFVDILTLYAVFGVILVLLFPLRNWVLILISCLLLSGIPLLSIIGFDHVKVTQTTTITPSSPPVLSADENGTAQPDDINSTLNKSTFIASAKENLTTNVKGKLRHQFVLSSRGYVTLALFILGFLVGRVRFFEEVHIKRKRNLLLLALFFAIGIAIGLVNRLISPQEPINLMEHIANNVDVPLIALINSSLNDIAILVQSSILALGFIVLYQLKGIGKYLDVLTPYGRMGLTNYEAQGVVGAILFSGWGFGTIFGGLSITTLFAIGLLIYALQIIISKIWLKHFIYGPLEWLWRSGTYLKWQPIKKTDHRVFNK